MSDEQTNSWRSAPREAVLRSLNQVVAEIPPAQMTAALMAHIEIARNLARALDDMSNTSNGSIAQARPATSREYTSQLNLILSASHVADPFLDGLFRINEDDPQCGDVAGTDRRVVVAAIRMANEADE